MYFYMSRWVSGLLITDVSEETSASTVKGQGILADALLILHFT
jgi:hypothetical protein